MKSSSLFKIVSALALGVGATGSLKAQSSPPPYVETTSLTFEWNFLLSYLSTVTQPAGAPPPADLDPSSYDPTEPISTDTSVIRTYDKGIGTQDFFIDRMVQALTRDKLADLDFDIDTPSVAREASIFKPRIGAPWQIVAVREVPKTVEEMATNPYTIYLSYISRVLPTGQSSPIDPVPVDPYAPETTPDLNPILINTGMTLNLGQWAATGDLRETYTDGIVTNASGRVTTAFTLSFGAAFYDDPRHAAADDAEPHQYHLKRHLWSLFANGHIIYNIRSIPGPYGTNPQAPAGTNLNGTFFASGVNMTGSGVFYHRFLEWTAEKTPEETYVLKEINPDTRFAYAGVAPVRVKMGNIQYQNRNMFPDFGVTPPPAP